MANKQVSELTALTSVASDDEIPINDISAGGEIKKITQDNLIPDASTTVKGKVELATSAETITGTDTVRAVTPAGAAAAIAASVANYQPLDSDLTAFAAKTAPSGAVVGDTDTQTLTNKTYTSPIIKTWDGWNTVSDTWTYASSTTITVPSGAASLYSVGDRIKLTQTSAKYFYIVAVADTLLTVTGGSDYTVANATITSPFVSHVENPVGFPHWFAYTPTGPTNTTLTGRFTLHGRTCTAVIRGAVTGAVDWTNKPTLPITSGASIMGVGTYFPYMRGGYLDSGASNNPNAAFGIFADGATTVTIYNSSAVAWSATVPITWANGDMWEIVGSYEI